MRALLDLSPMMLDFLGKAVLAIVCGGLIGAEREMRRKPAGFRTNILICLGSMLFMWISFEVTTLVGGGPADPGRIASQVVTGIGFLGAGTIIQSRGRVTGLTSAAMIWVVSAVGMAIGAGFRAVGILSTTLILMVQFGLGFLERRVFGKCLYLDCQVTLNDNGPKTRQALDRALQAAGRTREAFDFKRLNDHYVLRLQYCDVHQHHKRFLSDVMRIDGVSEVRTLG